MHPEATNLVVSCMHTNRQINRVFPVRPRRKQHHVQWFSPRISFMYLTCAGASTQAGERDLAKTTIHLPAYKYSSLPCYIYYIQTSPLHSHLDTSLYSHLYIFTSFQITCSFLKMDYVQHGQGESYTRKVHYLRCHALAAVLRRRTWGKLCKTGCEN